MPFEIQTSQGPRSILNEEEQPKPTPPTTCFPENQTQTPPIHMESHPYHRFYQNNTPFTRDGSISLPPLPSKSYGYIHHESNAYPAAPAIPHIASMVQYRQLSSQYPCPPPHPTQAYMQPAIIPSNGAQFPQYQQQQQQMFSLPPASPRQLQPNGSSDPALSVSTPLPPSPPALSNPVTSTKTSAIEATSPTLFAPSSKSTSKIASSSKPVKKYICSHCSRSFTTSGHLARHTRIHTGEKNYECPHAECSMRFSRQDNCMQHYRTHLGGSSRVGRGRGRRAGTMNNKLITNFNSNSNINNNNINSATSTTSASPFSESASSDSNATFPKVQTS